MSKFSSEIRQWCGLFAMPKNHRLPLLLAFLTGVLAYAVFIFHHLLDDHGNSTMPWIETGYWGYAFGRWTSRAIVALGYNADIPVINALISVLFLLLAGYYAFLTFSDKTEKNMVLYLIVGMVVVFPINLIYFFYNGSTMPFTASIFFAAVAARSCSIGTWIGGILGFIFLLLVWTTYQAAIGVFLFIMIAFWISAFLRSSRDINSQSAVLPTAVIKPLLSGINS